MDQNPSIGETVSYLLAGFFVVMLTLLALAVVCAIVGAIFRKFPVLAGKPESTSTVKTARKPLPQDGINPTLLAVIGAAVDQSLGGRYRIKSVTRVSGK